MPKMPLAVVVGLGPGLSSALVQRFAAGGYRVVAFARSPEKSEATVAGLRAQGLSAEVRAADAGDFTGLSRAISQAASEYGPVEVLLYNAYRATTALPSALDPGEAVEDFKVNVAAPLAAARAVLPSMIERRMGRIVLTGGGLALDPTGWLEAASLAIGKAGVRSLAQTLNKELVPSGVHAGTITIAGTIGDGAAFSPARIAEAYWAFVHDVSMPAELIYRG